MLIKTFNSVGEAAKFINITPGQISSACSGRYHTTGGYIWKYKEESIEGEIWKKILFKGNEYIISNKGRVKNKHNIIYYGSKHDDGYQRYAAQRVHILVATAFCKKKKTDNIVNHLDGNILNNCSENLEWTTLSGNARHSIDVLKNGTQRKVLQICPKTNNVIKEFQTIKSAAKECKAKGSQITKVCRKQGNAFLSGGYHWKYA